MSSPYDSFFWQLREMQRVIDSMRPQWDLIQTIPQEVIDQMEQFRRLEEQFTLPSDYLSAVTAIENSFRGGSSFQDLNFLVGSNLQIFEEIQVRHRELEAVVRAAGYAIDLYQPISELVSRSESSIPKLE